MQVALECIQYIYTHAQKIEANKYGSRHRKTIPKHYATPAHNDEQTLLMGIMGNELMFLIFGHKVSLHTRYYISDERYKLSYVNLNHSVDR